VVVVTHDPGIAARFRRRVTLRDGRLADETVPR
jgi:predicted ABC-type transport system involved in lysophospholipase L1 biosynthesis ATPase subunit